MNEELTVGATARLVGVSVRTLHHWDSIGLVTPESRTNADYRIYGPADIERIHAVLTYRGLGFPLQEVQRLLDDPDVDAMAHLRRQRELLTEQIDRLHQMAAAVEKMMEAKTMGVQLTPEEQREIFGEDWLGEEYADEAQRRWGDGEEWKQSAARTASFTKDDWRQIKAETDALEAEFAAALRKGLPADGPIPGQLAERQRAGIERFYDCDHAMHVCLAQMYLADERFRRHYEDVAAGLAQYVHDAIVANAAIR